LQQTNADKEETLRLRKTTLDLLPDAANNISRLEVRFDRDISRICALLMLLMLLRFSLYLYF